MGRYPALNGRLVQQLSAVPQTDGLYYPCRVTLTNGSVVDFVYLAPADLWYSQWGIWPEEDAGKLALDIEAVEYVGDSPFRLPPAFAAKLHAAGESGMGYTIFTVCFQDGSTMAVVSGNAIDFVDYPVGQSPHTVVDVLPHVGRDDPLCVPAPAYRWCLFDGISLA